MQNKNNLSPLNDSLRFLINCCKTNPSEEDTAFIHAYLNDTHLDTNALIGLANQHGILPLVYKTIKKINTDYPLESQDDFLSALKANYLSIAQRNMLMSAELIRIMKLLDKNGIEALAFKGPALSQMAYGDITLRQYSDLDIYIHREDIVKVFNTLSNDRYDSRVEIKYFSNEAFLHVNSDVQFYHQNGSMLIEIHWTVFRNAFSNTMKKINLWDCPKKIHIQNYELQTFNIETLLLYLCMHGSKHIWERIEWIVDIDKLIRSSSSIDWETTYSLAHTADGKTMLNLGLNLAFQLFDSPLPEDIQNTFILDKKILQLTSDVLKTLDDQEYFSDTELQKNYRHFRFHLSLRDRAIDKIGYIVKTLLPLKSSDVELINLPKGLYFLYYFLRPFRLASKYIQKIFFKTN